MISLKMILLLLTFIAVTTALTNNDGQCPPVYPVNNFNFTKYANGRWYEIARYDISWTDRADCVDIKYVQKRCGITFRVTLNRDGKRERFQGITPIPVNPGAGTVNHVSGVVRETEDFSEVPVSVLDTDYENYSIIYSCQYNQYTDKRTEFSWILSRYPHKTCKLEKSMDRFFKYSNVIDTNKLIWSGYSRGTC